MEITRTRTFGFVPRLFDPGPEESIETIGRRQSRGVLSAIQMAYQDLGLNSTVDTESAGEAHNVNVGERFDTGIASHRVWRSKQKQEAQHVLAHGVNGRVGSSGAMKE